MNLNLITESTLDTKVSNWQYADYYHLSCSAEFWSNASIVIISKSFIENRELAFVHLSALVEIEEQTAHGPNANVTIRELIIFLKALGYLPHLEGKEISIQAFWDNLLYIYENIRETPHSTFSKNGVKSDFNLPFIREDILMVIAFDDRWNQKLYFIEMHDSWGVFYWSTPA